MVRERDATIEPGRDGVAPNDVLLLGSQPGELWAGVEPGADAHQGLVANRGCQDPVVEPVLKHLGAGEESAVEEQPAEVWMHAPTIVDRCLLVERLPTA